jgi:Tfp pilus assembly protein PilV
MNALRFHTRRRSRAGFSLIETALTMAIIGFGVVSIMQLLAAGTESNSAGTEMTTAIGLANNVREITVGMSFRDPAVPNAWGTKAGGVAAYNGIMDFDGDTFQPPLDCRRQKIDVYSSWAQQVTVTTVAEDFLTSARPDDVNEPTAMVTVVILHGGVRVYQTSWLVSSPDP